MQENFKEINNPKFLLIRDEDNNIKYRIKEIRYKANNIKKENLIAIKSKNKLNNLKNKDEFQYLSSLKFIKVLIYKNDEQKYVAIPVNQKILKYDPKHTNLIIDDNKLKEKLIQLNINNDNEKFELNRGSVLMNKKTNELYYFVGFTNDMCELKNLKWNDKNRIRPTTNKLIEEYYHVELDELGNIYKIKNIKDLLDKNNKIC